MIMEWPVPRSFHNIQVFLGFANFYHHFIQKYSLIVAPLTDMLKGSENSRKKGVYSLTMEVKQAFQEIQEVFSKKPILQHYDPDWRI